MAGMLPGVELARRRRAAHHHHHHHHHSLEISSSGCSSRESSFLLLRPRITPTTTAATAMDETALKARTRLERKLRGDASRWSAKMEGTANKSPPWSAKKEGSSKDGGSNHAMSASKASMVKGRTEKACSSNRRKSEKEVCSICLEEMGTKQIVMNLPCSHSYHSDCLLPWLNVHSHCPYCRTHVQS